MRTTQENKTGEDRRASGRLVLVTGGAASGKSEYAENLAVCLYRESVNADSRKCGGRTLWYAAAMRRVPGDEETERRIQRHRRMRKGKGFRTIEQERRIGDLSGTVRPGDTVLLEDLSNLLANEMFAPGFTGEDSFLVRETIADPILSLVRSGVSVVAVGNSIAEEYPESGDIGIARYLEAFQALQNYLGREADSVYEVVCGIPVRYGE